MKGMLTNNTEVQQIPSVDIRHCRLGRLFEAWTLG